MPGPTEIRSSDLDGVRVETRTNIQSYGNYECQSWDVTSNQDSEEPEALQPTLTVR